MRKVSAKRVARLAILIAISAVVLFLTGMVPAGRLGLMVIASLPVAIAVMEYGVKWGFGVYAIVCVLSSLLFYSDAVKAFIMFFGYYPALKSLLEKLHSRIAELLVKFCLYSAAFWGFYFFISAVFQNIAWPAWAMYIVGAAVFFLYDWCYSVAIGIYIKKIARYIHD